MSKRPRSQSSSTATRSCSTICPLKVSGICEPIEAAGARLLYLPAYSPDFNPIERVFAKLKAIPRAGAARTVSDLWDTIKRAVRRFSTAECRNYLAAAGYDAYDPT